MAAGESASYQQRLAQFQQQLAPSEAALISKPNDIFYFTGFPQLAPAEREAFLVIFPEETLLFHHSFSPVPSAKYWLKNLPKTELKTIAECLEDAKTQKLFIDQDTLTVTEYFELKKHAKCELSALDPNLMWKLREIKDRGEIQKMKRAGKIAAKVMKALQKQLRVGITEREVANKAASLFWENQAEGPAFPVIVAFGAHGALPHHQPTAAKLKTNTPVLIDLGASFQGYYSDMTRTFWFGKRPSTEFLEVEKVVQTAYQQALGRLQQRTEPLTAKDIDDTARTVISAQNFGDQFIHTTGHGLGIEIHEPPSLSWQNPAVLQPGMAITIEPGIYLPGKFGYRHENTVLVTKKGGEILTTL